MSLNTFTEYYWKGCKRKKYNFNKLKAEESYVASKALVSVLPKDDRVSLTMSTCQLVSTISPDLLGKSDGISYIFIFYNRKVIKKRPTHTVLV